MSQTEVVTVGDDVKLGKDLFGTVRFIGEIYQRKGIYYGIELSEAKGKTNGTISNIRYFKCRIKRGLFVRRSRIIRVYPKRNNFTLNRIGINQAIQITMNDKKKVVGNVRYIGIPQKANQIYYGIEFKSPNIGNSNGLFHGVKYFHTKKNYAYFMKANSKRITNYSTKYSLRSSSTTTETETETETDSDNSSSNSNSSESKESKNDNELCLIQYNKYYKNREKQLYHLYYLSEIEEEIEDNHASFILDNDWMINALNAHTFKKRYECTRSLMEMHCGNSTKIPTKFNIQNMKKNINLSSKINKILHIFVDWLEHENHIVIRKHILQLLVPFSNTFMNIFKLNANKSIIRQIAKSLITKQWFESKRGFLSLVTPALTSIYVASRTDIIQWKAWIVKALLCENVQTQIECWDFLAQIIELSVLKKSLYWSYKSLSTSMQDDKIMLIAKNVLLDNKNNSLRLKCCLFMYAIVHCFNHAKHQSIYKQLLLTNDISLYFQSLSVTKYQKIFQPLKPLKKMPLTPSISDIVDDHDTSSASSSSSSCSNSSSSNSSTDDNSSDDDDEKQQLCCVNCIKKKHTLNKLNTELNKMCDEMKGTNEVICGLKIEKNEFTKDEKQWIINMKESEEKYRQQMKRKENMELQLFELRKQLYEFKKINNSNGKNGNNNVNVLNPQHLNEWTLDNILQYIISLQNGKYLKYEQNINKMLEKHKINGEELIKGNLKESDLRRCGINRFLHRKQLIKYINQLINEFNQFNIISEQLEGAHDDESDDESNHESSDNNGSVIIHSDKSISDSQSQCINIECNQCFKLKKESEGYRDDNDNIWYCLQCWHEFDAQQKKEVRNSI